MSQTTSERRVEQRLALDGQLHLVQSGFVAVEHHQASRFEPMDLPAQLRANRAPGPGDEDPASPQVAGHRREVGVHCVASEQVGIGEGPEVSHAHGGTEELGRWR